MLGWLSRVILLQRSGSAGIQIQNIHYANATWRCDLTREPSQLRPGRVSLLQLSQKGVVFGG
jgi:hypothetical protein